MTPELRTRGYREADWTADTLPDMPSAAKPAKTGGMRHIGPKRDVAPAPLVEFSVGFVRDGVEEVHEFAARPRLSYGDLAGIIKNDGDSAAITFLDRMIRRCLVNDDGTPQKWKAAPSGGKFEAPDGSTHALTDLPKFTAFEAGSSRRRWAYLMDRDDDVELEVEQVMQVFELLTEKVADRPT